MTPHPTREEKKRKGTHYDKIIRRSVSFLVRKKGEEVGKMQIDMVGHGVTQGARARIREWFYLINFEPLICPSRKREYDINKSKKRK